MTVEPAGVQTVGPALWRIEHGGVRIHVLGSAPPGHTRWASRAIDDALDGSAVFWTETPAPSPGAETQHLAMKYGVDAANPLETWLGAADLARATTLGAVLGVNAAMLAAVRPWLAVQVLQGAAHASRGLKTQDTPDGVLRARAEQRGIPVRSEFASTEDVLSYFASLPREAEIEYLRFTMDVIEAGPAAADGRHRRWAQGDLSTEEADAPEVRARYPHFYEQLVVTRNRAWAPRIREIIGAHTDGFILVGTGHMVGADSIPDLLAADSLSLERV